MTTITFPTEAADLVELGGRYAALADDRETRAARIRRRANEIDGVLAPLEVAMKRRACELELSAAALRLIASGQPTHLVW